MPPLIRTCALAGFGAWGIASSARAESMLASPHTEESNVILGAKSLASLQNVQSVERAAAFGVAMFGETTLVEDRLEFEFGVGLSRTAAGVEIAFEPLLKLPLSGTHRFDPYLALGPVLLKAEKLPLVYGGQLSAGSYVWLHETLGIDLDLSLALFYDRGPALELVLGAGPVLRI